MAKKKVVVRRKKTDQKEPKSYKTVRSQNKVSSQPKEDSFDDTQNLSFSDIQDFNLDFEDPSDIDLLNQPSRKMAAPPAEHITSKTQEEQDVQANKKINFEDLEKHETDSLGSNDPNSIRSNSYKEGVRTLKDVIAPDGFSVVDERTLKVGGKFCRNYVLQGYPASVQVGWLNDLYSYYGNLDTMIYIEPEDASQASRELTKQITQLTAQLAHDREKGIITNESKYSNEIAQLEHERAKIEMNVGSFYKAEIFVNLYADTEEDLRKAAAKLENDLSGKRMTLMPTALRMLDGYRSALPIMVPFYEDKFRNLNTGAVSACFPFYNAEICHPGGVLLGRNWATGTPMYLNMYDKHMVNNTNMSVFGRAGSGKSYFTSLLTMRSALQNIHTAIVDPEGEYGSLTRALGGLNIVIAPDSKSCINVFDVEEAQDVDDDGNLTGKVYVDIKGKVSDVVNLFGVMSSGELTQDQKSLLSIVVQELYAQFGITEDPKSLYEVGGEYDANTGTLRSTGRRKRMPTITDFHELLKREILDKPDEFGGLQSFANVLRMFRREGAYGLFDCQSTVSVDDFFRYPIINFDVHSLEEAVLRPIGMYISLTYIWEKFVKKNFKIRKRVVCDEAWMLMKKSMAGSEYTRQFLETCSRRIRKRNAGLLVASQNFIEFANCDEGKTVLSNTAVRIFLKQSNTDLDAVQSEFKLSDGEMEFLRQADTGQFLLKTDNETAIGVTQASPYEHALLTSKNAINRS